RRQVKPAYVNLRVGPRAGDLRQLDQHTIDDAENGRVCADPDRQRDDDCQRHYRSSQHRSQAEADISQWCFEHWNSSLTAISLFYLRQCSKISPTRVFGSEPSRAMLNLERLEVIYRSPASSSRSRRLRRNRFLNLTSMGTSRP